ncbi:methyltransferase domain-containing protein [Methylobacterium sp. 77]|uniref:methyltransferase domain-containing protein n=1 Tax=Methylobacterium sp. 77 TaxID=1101192 RepID=UPI00036D038A|nr:methyltransferase domain-containing protein [Methylobacterium sp. 77]
MASPTATTAGAGSTLERASGPGYRSRTMTPQTAPMRPWKQAVARAFDGAEGYDAAGVIQAVVAERLAQRIIGRPLPQAPRILEIGCGTGFLTQALLAHVTPSLMIASDLAPAMVQRARERLRGRGGSRFLVMDGERPCLSPGFDLICSSLAAQWFEDLETALGRLAGLLAPGGFLAVTTLASGTFREWHEAHHAAGHRPATPSYPTADTLARLRFEGCTSSLSLEPVVERHADGRAFLHSLRTIGAGTPASAGTLSPGALRAIIRRFEEGGSAITYEVAVLEIRRNP